MVPCKPYIKYTSKIFISFTPSVLSDEETRPYLVAIGDGLRTATIADPRYRESLLMLLHTALPNQLFQKMNKYCEYFSKYYQIAWFPSIQFWCGRSQLLAVQSKWASLEYRKT